jgi:hypothetical protein
VPPAKSATPEGSTISSTALHNSTIQDAGINDPESRVTGDKEVTILTFHRRSEEVGFVRMKNIIPNLCW